MSEMINIPGRLHDVSVDGVVAGANEIFDDDKNKKQSEINTETYTLVNNVNEMLSGLSPEQQSALSVAAKSTNNETKLGYYVCGTEGNLAAKVISDATGYILSKGGSVKVKMTNANTVSNATLNINSTGAKPLYYDGERASATNSWEAGETVEVYYDGTNFYANNVACGSGDGTFDISIKYPTSGVEGGNTYTLEGALAVLNTNLSARKKKGGMSIKFIQNSDNKYVQYRLMATSFSTTESDWQGVDDEPTAGSENLVKSGGVFNTVTNVVNSERERAELAEQNLQDNIDNIKDETLEENREMVNSIMQNYAPVEITGDVNNAADEEDLTSVNVEGTDVLKFKDKVYNPLVYSGMGRVLLRKNMVNGVNTLTQDMLYKGEAGSRTPNTNTIFVIQYDFTLGENITVPNNCVLEFDGGSIRNGDVVFNSTYITGSARFVNCRYDGNITIDHIDDREWTSVDDWYTLRFLLRNAIRLGVKAEFFRDYTVELYNLPGNESFQISDYYVGFENITSGAYIDFHGHSITNNTLIGNPNDTARRHYFFFRNVSNVTICNLKIYDLGNDGYEQRESGNFKHSKGCCTVFCGGDCDSINLINVYQKGGDNIIRTGAYSVSTNPDSHTNDNIPTVGLTNSTLIVKSENIGYSATVEVGNNLDIISETTNPHRGIYLGGVSNSSIFYKGYNAYKAQCHCLLKDSLYKKYDENGDIVYDIKECSNLKITLNVPVLLANETAISFATIGNTDGEADYSFRSGWCTHRNIDVAFSINSYETLQGIANNKLISTFSAPTTVGNEGCMLKVENVILGGITNIPIYNDGKNSVVLLQSTGNVDFDNVLFNTFRTVSEPTKEHNSNIVCFYGCHNGRIDFVNCNLAGIRYTLDNSGKITLNLKDVSRQGIMKLDKNVFINESCPKSNTLSEVKFLFSLSNHRYIIDNIIDLHNSDLTIPEGCDLVFDGGFFINYLRIFGSKTKISGDCNVPTANLVGSWYFFGVSSDRPGDASSGFIYFDTTIGRSITFDGVKYVGADGFPATFRKGDTNSRPNGIVEEYEGSDFYMRNKITGKHIFLGFTFKNTTDGKYYVATAIEGDTITWIDQDTVAGKEISSSVPRRGAAFPIDGSSIYEGFTFYNTAKGQWYEAVNIDSNNKINWELISHNLIFPSPENKGLSYFDTSINKTIYLAGRTNYWGDIKWVEEDGAVAGILRSGTYAQATTGNTKINASDVYEGFMYMLNDGANHFPLYAHINGSTVEWYKADGTQYTSNT